MKNEIQLLINSPDIFKVINYHQERTGISSSECRGRFEGLVEFLRLFLDDPKVRRVASEPVDDLWHDFLTFTETYERLCLKVAGNFVHHVPATTVPPSGYFQTRTELEKRVGSLNQLIWPLKERAQWSEGYVTGR